PPDGHRRARGHDRAAAIDQIARPARASGPALLRRIPRARSEQNHDAHPTATHPPPPAGRWARGRGAASKPVNTSESFLDGEREARLQRATRLGGPAHAIVGVELQLVEEEQAKPGAARA